jgi:NADH:ubiquinone oxidoreductase subunit E
MSWNLKEAMEYHRTQGAPGDQNALTNLLREVCGEFGGIPRWMLAEIAGEYGIKESFLQAIIKRIPSLRLEDSHCLELCGGPNCSKRARLLAFVENTYGTKPEKFVLKQVPCMRMCGKGPNLRWDGTVYNQADETLIRSLVEQ